jgi:hypothetical protein
MVIPYSLINSGALLRDRKATGTGDKPGWNLLPIPVKIKPFARTAMIAAIRQ